MWLSHRNKTVYTFRFFGVKKGLILLTRILESCLLVLCAAVIGSVAFILSKDALGISYMFGICEVIAYPFLAMPLFWLTELTNNYLRGDKNESSVL
jgi:hypothetical protein